MADARVVDLVQHHRYAVSAGSRVVSVEDPAPVGGPARIRDENERQHGHENSEHDESDHDASVPIRDLCLEPQIGISFAAMPIVVAVVALILLPPPFGEAQAEAVSLGDGLTIEVVVEVNGPFTVVLARPFSAFEQLPPTALSDLGDGTWGGFIELPTAENWGLVFDAFESDGTTVRSQATNLGELGVDRVIVAGEPEQPVITIGFSTAVAWLVVALVLLLSSLGALAWWTFSRDDVPFPHEDESR